MANLHGHSECGRQFSTDPNPRAQAPRGTATKPTRRRHRRLAWLSHECHHCLHMSNRLTCVDVAHRGASSCEGFIGCIARSHRNGELAHANDVSGSQSQRPRHDRTDGRPFPQHAERGGPLSATGSPSSFCLFFAAWCAVDSCGRSLSSTFWVMASSEHGAFCNAFSRLLSLPCTMQNACAVGAPRLASAPPTRSHVPQTARVLKANADLWKSGRSN